VKIHKNTYGFYARTVADALQPGVPILLSGPMGVGKSTFARAIIQACIPDVGHVPSPSFPIMIPYSGPMGTIWHVDLYRVADQDLTSLNLYDVMRADYTLIEWPERLNQKQLPAQYCAVSIDFLDAGCWEFDSLWRNIRISWLGPTVCESNHGKNRGSK
jgi:tRNA threonylcarbamoyladenosine biosynthesis protein TsaE